MVDPSRIAKGAIWRVAETGGAEVLSFLFFLALARLLSPAEFGLVAIASSICLVLQSLVQSGFPNAVVQISGLSSNHIRSAFSVNVLIGLAICVVSLGLVWPTAWALGRPNFPPLFIALLLTLILYSLSAPMLALLRRSFEYKRIALRTLVSTMLAGSVAISLASSGAGAWSLVAQQLTLAFMGFLMLLLVAPQKPWPFEWHVAALRELRVVAVPTMLADFAAVCARRLDPFIIGLFMADSQVGLYFLMSRLVLSVQMVTQYSIGEITFSSLSRLQGNPSELRNALRRSLRLTAYFCMLMFGSLAIVANPLVPIIFGSKWQAVVPPLQILAALSTFGALTWTLAQSFIAANHARFGSRLIVIVSAVQLIAVAVSAPVGIQAVVIASGCAQFLTFLPSMVATSKRFNLSLLELAGDLVPILGVGLIAITSALMLVSGNNVLDNILALLGFLLVLIVIGYFMLRQDVAIILASRR